MPTISDKLKIIKINKNFENNYRNNLLECLDILYDLDPEKSQCIEDLNAKYENFIKCLLFVLQLLYLHLLFLRCKRANLTCFYSMSHNSYLY